MAFNKEENLQYWSTVVLTSGAAATSNVLSYGLSEGIKTTFLQAAFVTGPVLVMSVYNECKKRIEIDNAKAENRGNSFSHVVDESGKIPLHVLEEVNSLSIKAGFSKEVFASETDAGESYHAVARTQISQIMIKPKYFRDRFEKVRHFLIGHELSHVKNRDHFWMLGGLALPFISALRQIAESANEVKDVLSNNAHILDKVTDITSPTAMAGIMALNVYFSLNVFKAIEYRCDREGAINSGEFDAAIHWQKLNEKAGRSDLFHPSPAKRGARLKKIKASLNSPSHDIV